MLDAPRTTLRADLEDAMSRVKVTVRSDAIAGAVVAGAVSSFASADGIPADDATRLARLVDGLVGFALEHAYPGDPWGELEVTVETGDGVTVVDVHDWG